MAHHVLQSGTHPQFPIVNERYNTGRGKCVIQLADKTLACWVAQVPARTWADYCVRVEGQRVRSDTWGGAYLSLLLDMDGDKIHCYTYLKHVR